jgi:hypothetical protein
MISLFRVLGRLRRLKKVVHTGGTQDPIRGFRNPYTIGFSAILRSLAESPSLSATLIKSMTYGDLLATLAAVISDRYYAMICCTMQRSQKTKPSVMTNHRGLFVVRRAGASMSAVDSVRRDAAFMTLLDQQRTKVDFGLPRL